MKILVINGPNLNKLGNREPNVYGDKSYEDLISTLNTFAKGKGIEINFFQSAIEGEIVNKILDCEEENIVLNAGAYTHYSIAIRDSIAASKKKVVEVHLSNVYKREEFRHNSVIAEVCIGAITGFHFNSYLLGIDALIMEANKN